jgi:hypothetical protein
MAKKTKKPQLNLQFEQHDFDVLEAISDEWKLPVNEITRALILRLIKAYQEHRKLKWPYELATEGEATGKVETFVMNDPKDKQAGSNPPIKKQKNE